MPVFAAMSLSLDQHHLRPNQDLDVFRVDSRKKSPSDEFVAFFYEFDSWTPDHIAIGHHPLAEVALQLVKNSLCGFFGRACIFDFDGFCYAHHMSCFPPAICNA